LSSIQSSTLYFQIPSPCEESTLDQTPAEQNQSEAAGSPKIPLIGKALSSSFRINRNFGEIVRKKMGYQPIASVFSSIILLFE
jgi:hypothetical protein